MRKAKQKKKKKKFKINYEHLLSHCIFKFIKYNLQNNVKQVEFFFCCIHSCFVFKLIFVDWYDGYVKHPFVWEAKNKFTIFIRIPLVVCECVALFNLRIIIVIMTRLPHLIVISRQVLETEKKEIESNKTRTPELTGVTW